ncbi:MAG TPA: ATP-binding protein [Solirubrobacteraceae bacterium]|jgi:signal transduction histidine kinase|nr:ATP-binding protein [Solirubrobacteraceae bacterium]
MSTTINPTVEELRTIDLFNELDDDAVAEWAARAEIHEVGAGELVSTEGEASRGVILLLSGTLRGTINAGAIDEPIADQVAPTWIGATAVLTQGESMLTLTALTSSRFALIAPEGFIDLIVGHRSVFLRVMAQIRPVIGRIAAQAQNRERLEALGTMAAGLAHELNNPAAAARRTAAELADALEVLSGAFGVFVESGLDLEHKQRLLDLQTRATKSCATQTALSALDAADAEDALTDALSDAGVEEPWRLAEAFSSAGLDVGFVEEVADAAGNVAPAALRWIWASLSARQLAAELADSTDQMGRLVKAIKSYAYMDRGEVVEIDLHEGLETTLTIMQHKLKKTEIKVERHYDRSLPKVMVRGAELNQVWTNLLANAIEALGQTGTIMISTRADGNCAEVHIADDGPGIPEEIQGHIFDPFYTTKDVGQGTGLGLDTARRIVIDRHHGSLTFDSRPGHTVFRVRIPIKTTQAAA